MRANLRLLLNAAYRGYHNAAPVSRFSQFRIPDGRGHTEHRPSYTQRPVRHDLSAARAILADLVAQNGTQSPALMMNVLVNEQISEVMLSLNGAPIEFLVEALNAFSSMGFSKPASDAARLVSATLSENLSKGGDAADLAKLALVCLRRVGRLSVVSPELFDLVAGHLDTLSVTELCLFIYESGRHALHCRQHLRAGMERLAGLTEQNPSLLDEVPARIVYMALVGMCDAPGRLLRGQRALMRALESNLSKLDDSQLPLILKATRDLLWPHGHRRLSTGGSEPEQGDDFDPSPTSQRIYPNQMIRKDAQKDQKDSHRGDRSRFSGPGAHRRPPAFHQEAYSLYSSVIKAARGRLPTMHQRYIYGLIGNVGVSEGQNQDTTASAGGHAFLKAASEELSSRPSSRVWRPKSGVNSGEFACAMDALMGAGLDTPVLMEQYIRHLKYVWTKEPNNIPFSRYLKILHLINHDIGLRLRDMMQGENQKDKLGAKAEPTSARSEPRSAGAAASADSPAPGIDFQLLCLFMEQLDKFNVQIVPSVSMKQKLLRGLVKVGVFHNRIFASLISGLDTVALASDYLIEAAVFSQGMQASGIVNRDFLLFLSKLASQVPSTDAKSFERHCQLCAGILSIQLSPVLMQGALDTVKANDSSGDFSRVPSECSVSSPRDIVPRDLIVSILRNISRSGTRHTFGVCGATFIEVALSCILNPRLGYASLLTEQELRSLESIATSSTLRSITAKLLHTLPRSTPQRIAFETYLKASGSIAHDEMFEFLPPRHGQGIPARPNDEEFQLLNTPDSDGLELTRTTNPAQQGSYQRRPLIRGNHEYLLTGISRQSVTASETTNSQSVESSSGESNFSSGESKPSQQSSLLPVGHVVLSLGRNCMWALSNFSATDFELEAGLLLNAPQPVVPFTNRNTMYVLMRDVLMSSGRFSDIKFHASADGHTYYPLNVGEGNSGEQSATLQFV